METLQMLAEEAESDADIPAALRDQPEIEAHLQLYWEAFSELSTDRQTDSNGVTGPIPFSAIDRYAERYGFKGDEFDSLRSLMRVMDGAYLKAQAERRKRAADKRK